ncbi:MAG: uridine phosphorylase [Deltaproteobacteria bacterium]|nr:uridine phosphorylase [Deltaproteobacteria bacterium]
MTFIPNPGPFAAADLPIHDGRTYHLGLAPDELAQHVIICGDPGRVERIAELRFNSDTIRANLSRRGLRTITGTDVRYGIEVTVTTTGMGTPSLETTVGEICIARDIDFVTRTRHPVFRPLNIIRLGTSGLIRKETPVGTLVIGNYAIGLDNTGLWYDADEGSILRSIASSIDEKFSSAAKAKGETDPRIRSYVAAATPAVVDALVTAAANLRIDAKLGVMVAHPTFFASQGRNVLRTPVTVPDVDLLFEHFPAIYRTPVECFEMQSSAFYRIFGPAGEGHRVATICVGVSNRRTKEFEFSYGNGVDWAVEVVMSALSRLQSP